MNRVILPASPHARGARPFIFRGESAHDPAPGVRSYNGRISAPVDAAWIFDLPCAKGAPWPWMGGIRDIKIPLGLYGFQLEGAQFLAQRDYAVLADEMGIGKTVQALAAAELRLTSARSRSVSDPHVLIVCPSIAKRHWQREIARWTGYTAQVLDGMRPTEPLTYRYIVVNYDILYGQRRRDSAGKLQEREGLEGWGKILSEAAIPIVILDEAHNLRGTDSRRTEAVKKVCEKSTVVWGLTGNPMPNAVRDFWALGDLVSGGLLGGFWPWAKAYCGAYRGQYGWEADGSSNLEELNKRLSFWVMGRTKASVALQLPDKRREIAVIDVGEVKQEPLARDQGKQNAVALALRATARAKRAAIVESASEALSAGQKVVVFVYMRDQADSVAKEIACKLLGCRVWAVSGDMSPEGRDTAAGEFRDHAGPGAFVATIDSVGVAISLVGADLLIFGDLSYEPWKLLQAEGRAHRIGSGTPILVRYLIAAGTIDETVQEAVIEKLATVEAAMGGISDGRALSVQLGRDISSTEQIVDRLFAKLTGGK